MNTTLTTTAPFTNEAIETHLSHMETEVQDFARVQGEHDSREGAPITEPKVRITVFDPIFLQVQKAIDLIKQKMQITSHAFNAKEARELADKRITALHKEMNHADHQIIRLKREKDALTPDPLKRYGKWIIVLATVVSVLDAIMAFVCFQRNEYSPLMAGVLAIAIGILIFSGHLFVRWIKAASTEMNKRLKIAVVLISALIVFCALGQMRANAVNDVVDLSLSGSEIAVPPTPVSSWPIALVSFGLFCTVFFASLLFWKSKQERIQERSYHEKCRALAVLSAQREAMQQEVRALEANAVAESKDMRQRYGYALTAIARAKTIGRHACQTYKQSYLAFHTGPMPPFFSNTPEFQYDDTFILHPQPSEP